MNYLDVLNWTDDQLKDLRAVGYSYIRQGLYERAILFFEGLSALVPESAADWRTLGALYLQSGNAKEAIKAIDRALHFDHHDQVSLLNRAKALFVLGERAEGLATARSLVTAEDPRIRNLAEALVMAYS